MKILFAALIPSLFAFASQAQTTSPKQGLKALDEKNGFRDMKFGSDSSALEGRKIATRKGVESSYVRPSDNMQIGEAKARMISYFYYKGKLAYVGVSVQGVDNTRALKNALEAQYSFGTQENQYIEKYTWDTKKVMMTYDINPITHEGMMLIFSRDLLEQHARNIKTAAKNADL